MKNLILLVSSFFCFVNTAKSQQDSSVNGQHFLPLQITGLDAAVRSKNVQLVWTINSNEEARAFEIERAEEDGNYQKVGSKLSLGRTGAAGYEFVDALPKKNTSLSYRIKIIAKEGLPLYSATQTIRVTDAALQCRLKQNPVHNSINVEVVSALAGTLIISVYTAYGQTAITETTKLSNGVNHLSFSSQALLPGLHRLVLESGAERAVLSFVKD